MSQESISVSISEITLAGLPGPQGASAYEVAVANGFEGDETAWLASLEGDQGLSAYDVAVANGFEGDESAWLESLDGADGANGVSFQPDATGLLSTRSTYDAQASGFVFLATDTGDLYFRETSTAGVWSLPVPFSMPLLAPSGNPYLQAYLDRLAASSFDISRFDRKLHDDIFDAAGSMMEDCHGLFLNRGAMDIINRAANVTISIASPGVITWTSHGLVVADPVVFQTTGALPTGIVAGQTYYVQNVVNDNGFRIAETPFGSAINTSGTQSGTHSARMLRQDIAAWINAAQDNNATALSLNYTTFRSKGFPLRPFLRSDGTLQAKNSNISSAGFNLSGSPFGGTPTKFMVFALFSQDEITLSFPTTTERNAATELATGTRAVVSSLSIISTKEDVPGTSTWNNLDPFVISGSGADRYEVFVQHALPASSPPENTGKIFNFMFGTGVNYQTQQLSDPIQGQGKQLVAIYFNGSEFEVYRNGARMRRNNIDLGTFANLTALQFMKNGVDSVSAIVIFKNAEWDAFRKIHDALAKNYVMPLIEERPLIVGFSLSGQSRSSGSTEVTSPGWVTARGWNGETTGNFKNSPTIDLVEDWIAAQGITTGTADVGSIFQYQAFSSRSMTPSLASDGIVFGLANQILASNPNYIGWLAHWGVGGTPIASLRKPEGNKVISTLISPVPSSLYERGIRQILKAKQYADKAGYRFEMGCFIWMHGESDSSNVNYAAEVIALYDEFNADCKRITGQSNDVVMMYDMHTYSDAGIANDAAPINARQLSIIANRESRPIFVVAPGYPISNFIHWPSRGYRMQGEQFGKAWNQIRHGSGNFTGVTIVSAVREASAVLLTFNVPVPPLQFDTNNNNVETLLTNRGFEYLGGGRTITSVELVGTTQVRINLSGPSGAGHSVAYVKGDRYGNLCDSDATTPIYPDQDWTQEVWPAPLAKDGLPNDLRNWAIPFEIELS